MNGWASQFSVDPITPLLTSGNHAVRYFALRDLMDDADPRLIIRELPEVSAILIKQQQDGSWNSRKAYPVRYPYGGLAGTWKQLRFLVGRYELDNDDPAVRKASEFVFSCQSDEGDFRGILANQYAPYYTGPILSLLIGAGYQNDKRVTAGMQWLLDMRQDDGGWIIGSPGLMHKTGEEINSLTGTWTPEPERDFDRALPFSAAGTGMAIRALAAHTVYRKSPEARRAAMLLKSKFFRKDNWASYRHPDNWVRFEFPYWWNNLVSALDAVSLIGLPENDPDIRAALEWLVRNQQSDGLWNVSYSSIHKSSPGRNSDEMRLWISLCICRIFKRYYGN
jgi:squalene cyclase